MIALTANPLSNLPTSGLVLFGLILLGLGVWAGIVWETSRLGGTADLHAQLVRLDTENGRLRLRSYVRTWPGRTVDLSSSAMRHLGEQRDRRG